MPNVRLEPLVKNLHLFDVKELKRAIENAGNMSAKAVEADFVSTVTTWEHKPKFTIEHTRDSGEWDVGTDDKIYGYVSEGTRAHVIKPKDGKRLVFFRTGFKAKSVIGSRRSNIGKKANKDLTFAKQVQHPGTEARKFPETINRIWDKEWPRQIARAIRAVMRYK